MAIEREDLRLKLAADTHAGMKLLADVDDKSLADWAEQVIEREVRRRIHAATVIADRARRQGIAGESQGTGAA